MILYHNITYYITETDVPSSKREHCSRPTPPQNQKNFDPCKTKHLLWAIICVQSEVSGIK